MKSELPKGLHRVCGQPILEHIGRAMEGAGAERVVLVVGHGRQAIEEFFGARFRYEVQEEQNGTGHACRCALPSLEDFAGDVIVGTGDSPLVDSESMRFLVDRRRVTGAAMVIGSCVLEDPSGYGRVVRDPGGRVTGIVEHKDADEEQLRINEINAAFYCFSATALKDYLPRLTNDNAKGEYYLTDLAHLIALDGGVVETLVFEDADMMRGVNDRWQLAEAAALLRQRIMKRHALAGVTIVDPTTTHIEVDVEIGQDTVILPGTHLEGFTKIGAACEIGPMTRISDCEIGASCTILMSHLARATIGAGTRIGPYANIRPHTKIGEAVKIGNFVEIKNAAMGDKASASHLAYIGDADVGDDVNIGAGTITCNYDGFGKHRTNIGEGAFVGSNSTLVAPVTIGKGSFVAAGSTITEDVPDDSLAVGRSRQVVKEGWAARWRSRKSV